VDNSFDKAIGFQIKVLRERHSLSQESLASLAGISRTHLAQIEVGNVSPTVRTLRKISDELSIQMSELISDAEEALDD